LDVAVDVGAKQNIHLVFAQDFQKLLDECLSVHAVVFTWSGVKGGLVNKDKSVDIGGIAQDPVQPLGLAFILVVGVENGEDTVTVSETVVIRR